MITTGRGGHKKWRLLSGREHKVNYNVIFQPFLVGLIKEKKRNTTKQIIFIVLTVEIMKVWTLFIFLFGGEIIL